MAPPPLGPGAAPVVSSNQGNVLSRTAVEAGLLLPSSQSLPGRSGRTNEPIASFPQEQHTAAHYAQMARVLSRFNTAHEENWRLSELYGVEAKRAWVGALGHTLTALRHHSHTAQAQAQDTHAQDDDEERQLQLQQAKAEAQVLLGVRTCLRERTGAEDNATTTHALGLYVRCLQDHRPSQISAGVPHMALRCLMNGSGQRPDVQETLWNIQAPQAILHTLTQGGVLSCEGLCLGLRLLYHTCASANRDGKGRGGFARLAHSTHKTQGEDEGEGDKEGPWLTLLVPGRGRGELGVMVLRCLFGVHSEEREGKAKARDTQTHDDSPLMTQLGVLCVEVLLLPQHTHPHVYNLKIDVCKLLLQSPASYLSYVVHAGALLPLLDLLTWQAETVTVEKTASPSADVCPLLALLTALASHSTTAASTLKQSIFPPLTPQHININSNVNVKDLTLTQGPGGVCGVSGARFMEPLDAPKHSTRHKLIRLMQVSDVTTQRLAAEFLYALCQEDADEFVSRTGFGSAAGLLQVKGILDVPASS